MFDQLPEDIAAAAVAKMFGSELKQIDDITISTTNSGPANRLDPMSFVRERQRQEQAGRGYNQAPPQAIPEHLFRASWPQDTMPIEGSPAPSQPDLIPMNEDMLKRVAAAQVPPHQLPAPPAGVIKSVPPLPLQPPSTNTLLDTLTRLETKIDNLQEQFTLILKRKIKKNTRRKKKVTNENSDQSGTIS